MNRLVGQFVGSLLTVLFFGTTAILSAGQAQHFLTGENPVITRIDRMTTPELSTGNFNPTASLDTNQVVRGAASDPEDQTMFCFDADVESGWDCFLFEDIPSDDYHAGDDHLVWAGPVRDVESAYDRLNP